MTEDEFFAKHDADPRAVYLVEIVPGRFGIFSTKALLDAWLDTIPEEEGAAVVSPFYIDVPEYGEIPRKKMT